MNEFLSEKVKALKPSGIRKFFDIVKEIPGAISLGVGEPDFETPYHIREAGIQALQAGKTFYTSNSGLMELRKAVSDFTKRRTGLTYDPASEIMLTVGGSEAIDVALRTIINPGDEVIYIQPSYVSYLPCILLADGVPVPIELKAENRFRLTREELEAAITPKTKALILSFPNNPTGAIMEKEDLEAIVDVIKEHHILVISDEIYSELTYGKEHVSIASLPGMKEYSIVINGFSKGFAMTGWRLGYALGNKEILKQMIKIHQYAIMCAPTVSQYAAIEAMYNGDQDVIYMRESYNQRRRFLYHELQRLGLPCFLPEGAFYMFLKSPVEDENDFCAAAKKYNILMVPGTAFACPGYVRLAYCVSHETIVNSMDGFRNLAKEYGLL